MPISIVLLFSVIFALVSFPNHYYLRTYALDLGMFNHALYDFAHGRANYFTLNLHGRDMPYLADHFSPITFLYAPLQYIFGSWTPLVIQWLAILAGGWGMFRLSMHLLQNNIVRSSLIMFHFFSIWGILFALSFDFHNNVIAAMLVPWLFLCFEKKQRAGSWLCALLIMLSKENMALWLVFLISGYGMLRFRDIRSYLRQYLLPSLLVFLYFILVLIVIMPALGADQNSQTGRYGNPSALLQQWIQQPLTFAALWTDINENGQVYHGMRNQVWLMLLLSGGIFMLRRPAFLWMILPILAQKFLSGDPNIIGITHHYSIEFVPVLSTALLWQVKAKQEQKLRWLPVICLITLAATIWSIHHTFFPGYNNRNIAFYMADHYRSEHPDIGFIRKKLRSIPEEAAVSTSSELSPHLALRRRIYHYPNVRDASYIIVLNAHTNFYPLGEEEFRKRIQTHLNEGFAIVCNQNDLLILHKE